MDLEIHSISKWSSLVERYMRLEGARDFSRMSSQVPVGGELQEEVGTELSLEG